MTAAVQVPPNDLLDLEATHSMLRLPVDGNTPAGDGLLIGGGASDQVSEPGLYDSDPCLLNDDSSSCHDVDDDNKPEQDKELQTYSHADLQALNLLDQPVWIFDIVRRGMWWANHAAVELWSAPDLKTLLARDFASDMSESTANRLDDYLLKFSSKDEVVKDRWTFYPNGGKYGPKTVDCTFRGIMIEEGRLAMLSQGVFVNDQQRTEAEQQALRASEMLRHLPVAVCLTDLEGNVMEQNPEALKVFGSLDTGNNKEDNNNTTKTRDDEYDSDSDDDEDELEKADESTFVKRFVDKDLGRRILNEAAKTGDDNGKNVIRLEALQHTVHGPRWSAIQVRQTKDPVTSKPILLYSARDITAVVEAKRQATAADLAKMDLLTDMAHAVRTPLQHVVGVVELISRQGQSKCQAQQQEETRFGNLLQSAAQLLMNVINDLMVNVGGGSSLLLPGASPSDQNKNVMVNKPANRILLEHTQIDVRKVVENAIGTITPQADVKNLTFNVQMTRNNMSSLMGDAKRLGQVLFEMLHNAVKYTSTGGITVKVRRHTKKSRSRRVLLRFEVTDTGVGLNLEQQKQCLQVPESSANNSAQEKGVGLVLCKSLVEAMGGTIGVDSKPGRGSTFWFEIPFLRAASQAPVGTKMLPPKQSKKCKRASDRSVGSIGSLSLDPVPDEGGLQILLVDENNAGRNVMTALLEQSGHRVTTADTGDDMVSAVSQGSFDVVLLEAQLGSDGGTTALDAVQQIRKAGHSVENLPILALTAAVPRADYPELGLNDWLTKPILMKDIKTAMTNAICNVGASSASSASSSRIRQHSATKPKTDRPPRMLRRSVAP
ncbi:respiration control sensor protein ArcB [Seminavis robusta]|uniref:histidine kinase n=1 Tax=Seminavis robusta TaxID=568900 RepID=A0A9N8DX49_9STRA|nr:respiration control sensor protein ArcB [Seminavis robusta]|eukprot:Sro442_g143910.1 respiration control sensor protein ArcB (830) ;mRNA; r:37753-40566